MNAITSRKSMNRQWSKESRMTKRQYSTKQSTIEQCEPHYKTGTRRVTHVKNHVINRIRLYLMTEE